MNEKNFKEIKLDPQKKLDIIFNIPGFKEFIEDALNNGKLKLSDYMYLGDLEPTKEYDVYLKLIK